MQSRTRTVEIIAHRGASGEAPENTLAAFDLAVQQGADRIEFDVRRAADGVLFIHHDATRDGHVLADLTYGQIVALPGAENVPRLSQVLELAQGRIKLDVELKEGGYEEEVLGALKASFAYDAFVVSSFSDSFLAVCHRLDPNVKLGLLVGKRVSDQSPVGHVADLFPMRRVRRLGACFVATHYTFGHLAVRRHLRKNGVPVAVWTVNDAAEITRNLADPNVFALITNYPKLAVQLRDAGIPQR